MCYFPSTNSGFAIRNVWLQGSFYWIQFCDTHSDIRLNQPPRLSAYLKTAKERSHFLRLPTALHFVLFYRTFLDTRHLQLFALHYWGSLHYGLWCRHGHYSGATWNDRVHRSKVPLDGWKRAPQYHIRAFYSILGCRWDCRSHARVALCGSLWLQKGYGHTRNNRICGYDPLFRHLWRLCYAKDGQVDWPGDGNSRQSSAGWVRFSIQREVCLQHQRQARPPKFIILR